MKITPRVPAMIQLNTNSNYPDHEAHARLHEDMAKQALKNKLIAYTAKNHSGSKLTREEN